MVAIAYNRSVDATWLNEAHHAGSNPARTNFIEVQHLTKSMKWV